MSRIWLLALRSLFRYSFNVFDQAEWLREAVSKFEGSQAELGRQVAARLGLTEDRSRLNKSLKHSKSGKARKLTLAELVAISEITHHPLPAGYNEEEGRTVTVVGIAAAGSDTISYAEGQGHLDEVAAPHGSNEHTVAVEVRGGSLGPVFEGWLAFYDDRRDPPTDDLIGHMCIVGLASGQVVIKRLERGQLPNRFNLRSNTEPPIYDAEVEWAAKVKSMTAP